MIAVPTLAAHRAHGLVVALLLAVSAFAGKCALGIALTLLLAAPLGAVKLADALVALAGVLGTETVAAVEKAKAEGESEGEGGEARAERHGVVLVGVEAPRIIVCGDCVKHQMPPITAQKASSGPFANRLRALKHRSLRTVARDVRGAIMAFGALTSLARMWSDRLCYGSTLTSAYSLNRLPFVPGARQVKRRCVPAL